MHLQRLLSLVRQAIDDYQLIDTDDSIAVGVSGGKDSLVLLTALHYLRRFYPRPFDLHAITVNIGFNDFDLKPVQNYCDELSIPYSIIDTDIARIVFDERQESNPCSLCAKLRKGAFNQKALELGCNKIAYAHHRDDLINTLFMSMIYEGNIHTISPKTNWDRTGLTLIRPLIYVQEVDIIGFQRKYNLPVCKNPCPVDKKTAREYVNNLTKRLNQENPGVKDRIFRGILNATFDDWPDRINK
ncbi:MAG: tRNA 2-thiocytidine(32) synthetase TtcA [Lachnospiraceae bacterium]|nr:tRNA 2-thiocytidine(32) synthetase TtcA [Lachnospiraceae bacterium]